MSPMQTALAEYGRHYQAFLRSASQTKLIAQFAGELFTNFPRRLPPELRKKLKEGLRSWASKTIEVAKAAMKEPGHKIKMEWISDDLLEAAVAMLSAHFLAHRGEKTKVSLPNFRDLIYEQELVMLLAHLDAFFDQSVRAMCVAEPRILHGNKELTWSDILHCENFEGIIRRMIETYTLELGVKPVAQRFKHLQGKHGLKIALEEGCMPLRVLDDAEALRNIIVHNGGRVSREYLKRTKRSDVKIGDVVSVDEGFRGIAYLSVRICAEALYRGVAEFVKVGLGGQSISSSGRGSVTEEAKSA